MSVSLISPPGRIRLHRRALRLDLLVVDVFSPVLSLVSFRLEAVGSPADHSVAVAHKKAIIQTCLGFCDGRQICIRRACASHSLLLLQVGVRSITFIVVVFVLLVGS